MPEMRIRLTHTTHAMLRTAARDAGLPMYEYVESLITAAVTRERTVDAERAAERASTDKTARAEGRESAVDPERAVQREGTVTVERPYWRPLAQGPERSLDPSFGHPSPAPKKGRR